MHCAHVQSKRVENLEANYDYIHNTIIAVMHPY